jgi:hypothetical protein
MAKSRLASNEPIAVPVQLGTTHPLDTNNSEPDCVHSRPMLPAPSARRHRRRRRRPRRTGEERITCSAGCTRAAKKSRGVVHTRPRNHYTQPAYHSPTIKLNKHRELRSAPKESGHVLRLYLPVDVDVCCERRFSLSSAVSVGGCASCDGAFAVHVGHIIRNVVV